MDAASGLVEAFLRVNGYLTLSEWQIQGRDEFGQWTTITDVDIVGLRFPGDIYLADSHDPEVRKTLQVGGELLMLEDDTIDVIIGEVKEGEAVFNPSLTREETLHTVLQRLAWLYQDTGAEKVVHDLGHQGTCRSPAPGGGTVRTRLVAFGQAKHLTENMVPIGSLLEKSAAMFVEHDELLRSARAANPVSATLKLLHKTGFQLKRDS